LGRFLFEAARAVDLFKLEQSQSFWQARCEGSCDTHHSFVRARREPLERSVVPRSSREGFCSKPCAQLTFSSWNKVKAFGKLDAKNLAILTKCGLKAVLQQKILRGLSAYAQARRISMPL